MSIYGLTKDTELQKMVQTMAQAEANGTMMYYALARLAREQGMEAVASAFIEIANQEAGHAGFYAVLSGKYPQNFWDLVRSVQKLEENGENQIMGMAAKVREAGFDEAADEMEIFAKEEDHHGVLLKEILEKYAPKETAVEAGKKVYVCPVCGYEHAGEMDEESDDYTCPICGQPKSAFVEK